MNIYPQDLGPQSDAEIQNLRQMFPGDQRDRVPVTRVRAVTEIFRPVALCVLVMGAALHHFGFAISCVAAFILIWVIRGVFFREKRVTPVPVSLMMHEVRHLQQTAKDTLVRSYFEMIITAIEIPSSQDEETERSVREAVLALASGIADLSPHIKIDPHQDPLYLQTEAGKLTADADREPDAVVTSSLRRRAEALLRQAEIAGQTALLLRRNEALRLEVAGQIAALQTSLTALRVGGSQAVYELAGVAASIQQVALEAGALTQARSEIGDIVSQTLKVRYGNGD
jgi:hypothetical protein